MANEHVEVAYQPQRDAAQNEPQFKQTSAMGDSLARLKALGNQRVATRWTEEDRAFNRSATWGLAGVGALLLIAIGTTRPQGSAMWLATACFAISVPMLVTVGLIGMAQTDPRNEPPIAKDLFRPMMFLWLSHGLFYFGFAAFLWSYDTGVGILYVISLIVCLRIFIRHAKTQKRKNPQPGSDILWD